MIPGTRLLLLNAELQTEPLSSKLPVRRMESNPSHELMPAVLNQGKIMSNVGEFVLRFGKHEIRVRGDSMSMVCTRCEGSGFLNVDQVPIVVQQCGADSVMNWLESRNNTLAGLGRCSCSTSRDPPCRFCEEQHDVQVCDCCGDGVGHYGIPGEHYNPEDPPGDRGPYENNGGLAQCH